MFLLNQSFLFSLKQLVYKIDKLNRNICPLNCSQQNEQVKKKFRPDSKRIDKIIEKLKTRKQQSNNIDEYISLPTDQQSEHINPVTYITETAQKSHENPIIDYPTNNDNIFISKQNDQKVIRESFSYIEDTMIETGNFFSNTVASVEQTNTIQSSAADSIEQLVKLIDCRLPGTSFYENIFSETLNDLTNPTSEIFSSEKKLVCEQPSEFNFLSSNEEGLYYHSKIEMEEDNVLTKHQTSQKKEVYEKQRLQSKSKRSSKEMDGLVVKPSGKKSKFNNEDRNKKFLKRNNSPDDRQNQLNILGNDNHNSNLFYTEPMDLSNTDKQHKPDTYQIIGINSNQIQKQIGRDFCQNTVCTAQNYTITNPQISTQQTHNNRNIRNEFRLGLYQKDENIFKGIQEIETNTNIKVCYIKVPENTHVDGVRETTTSVKIDFMVNVTKSLKNEQPIMFFLINRVPIFLCPEPLVYSVDLEYKVNEQSTNRYTFFRNIKITIIQPEDTNLCVSDILPKFTFILKKDFFRTGFYVNKIYKLLFDNAEFDIDYSKKTHYRNNQHKKRCLKGKLSKTHAVQHILLKLEVHKKAVKVERCTDTILNNAIIKLEVLRSHLNEMSGVSIIEEEDLKKHLSQIIEFIKIFCKEKESAETLETGPPKAKNLKRAFFRVLLWLKKHKCTFDSFYDIF
ncbi:hypothetical protein CDIK_2811 [Cucumispora dikerogammari]|nr:hypothetical protein CDIK_2811 [Cucumispora dikerogammari]